MSRAQRWQSVSLLSRTILMKLKSSDITHAQSYSTGMCPTCGDNVVQYIYMLWHRWTDIGPCRHTWSWVAPSDYILCIPLAVCLSEIIIASEMSSTYLMQQLCFSTHLCIFMYWVKIFFIKLTCRYACVILVPCACTTDHSSFLLWSWRWSMWMTHNYNCFQMPQYNRFQMPPCILQCTPASFLH